MWLRVTQMCAKLMGLGFYSIEKGCAEEISSLISRNNSLAQNLKGTKVQGRRYLGCSAALSPVLTAQEKEFSLHPLRFSVCNPSAWTPQLHTAIKSVAHKQATAEHGISKKPWNKTKKPLTPKQPRKKKTKPSKKKPHTPKPDLYPKCRAFL